MSNIELTEDEKDCLQELMNVAYGSATAAITEIFDAFAKLITSPINNLNYSIILYGKNRCKKIITQRVV